MTGGLRRQDDPEDRGVSEVVGFILVFAVIIISVGLLYTTAFQSMHSYQEGEQVKAAAQGMEALSSNFNDVQRQGGVDQRSGELTLRDGTMRLEEGTHISITVDGGSPSFDDQVGSLTYQSDSSTISYEGGALFEGAEGVGDQSTMTNYPLFTCGTGDQAVISLLVLNGEERSIQTSGNHRFTLVQETVHSYTGESVSIEASGKYGETWHDEFLDNEDELGDCTASTVVVRIVEATVEF